MAPETDCHLHQQNVGVLFMAFAGVGVLYRALSTSGQGSVGSRLSLKAELPHSPHCWVS